jgi:hypothetical protein
MYIYKVFHQSIEMLYLVSYFYKWHAYMYKGLINDNQIYFYKLNHDIYVYVYS